MLAFLKSGSGAETPELVGERIFLRTPRHSDWREWVDIRSASREFLEPWEPRWPPDALTRAAYRRRLQRQFQDTRNGVGYGFHIMSRDDDAILGGATLSNIQRGIAMSCSLGYWIAAPHAGRGYMTEAVHCLLPFVFDTLDMHRLEAACLPANEASQKLLRKVGFNQEGYARGYLRINGTWQDHLLFAMLARDFETLRNG